MGSGIKIRIKYIENEWKRKKNIKNKNRIRNTKKKSIGKDNRIKK